MMCVCARALARACRRAARQFLHHFDADVCVALLRRLRGALRPGGLLAVNDFLRAADAYGPWTADPQPFQFNYLMLLTTERGRRSEGPPTRTRIDSDSAGTNESDSARTRQDSAAGQKRS